MLSIAVPTKAKESGRALNAYPPATGPVRFLDTPLKLGAVFFRFRRGFLLPSPMFSETFGKE